MGRQELQKLPWGRAEEASGKHLYRAGSHAVFSPLSPSWRPLLPDIGSGSKGQVLYVKTGGLGLSDFSGMAKCLRELGSRDEQAAGPAWDVGCKWVHKTWRRGDISGARVQLPMGATAFICGYKSTQKGRPVSVCQAGHQCCNRQIFHSSLAASWGRKRCQTNPPGESTPGKGASQTLGAV